MANTAKEYEAKLQGAAVPVRDPTPGVLESDGRHDRHSGYDGIGPGTVSRNARKQGHGDKVVPMLPGNGNDG